MKNRMLCETIQRFQQNVKNIIGYRIALGTTLALFMLSGLVSAQSGPAEFVPFRNFIDQTVTADAGDYLARPASKVKDAAAFEEMRQHILNMYQDVEVNHSFVLDSAHYDCVPIEQQPAVRKYGIKKIATPPPQSLLDQSANAAEGVLESPIGQAQQLDPENPFDAFGNSVHCEENTIPMRRITLDAMSHFQTLRQFFQKSPNEQAPGQREKLPPGGPAHKYSTTFQYVNNLGGQSNLNVWAPLVNTSLGEGFSLSQEWYVGGINTGVPPCGGPQSCSIQTEEVGWVVYPDMFGDENPHFFIFSTPDGYATGCWNNSCGDFVQTKDAGILGASLHPVSTLGGTQYEISSQYQLFKGNWWVSYAGTFIGYYPGTMYHGGQNTKHAQVIEFGTESTGTNVWPPEGSGQWPSKGFKYAAYQRNLFYINTAGKGIWDSLTPDISSPKCYSIGGPFSGTGAWTVYFYEGGPGGGGC
jgi:hypothetical protein